MHRELDQPLGNHVHAAAATQAADYLVRIFTPAEELPFAGYPTLGTCHAWLAGGGTPARDGVVVQECGAGLITIRNDKERLAFSAPPRASVPNN